MSCFFKLLLNWESSMLFDIFDHAKQDESARQRGLRSFTWVSWGYLPSIDISCRPHFHRFLSSFLCCYLFSKCNKNFFILVFPDPTLLSLSFPVFYFPCLLLSTFLLCLSLHILYFLFLSFLSVFYFLSCCLLSFSSNFLCLPSNFSFYFYLSLCLSFYFPSLISSTFILCLSSILFLLLLTLLFILLRICVYVLLLLLLLLLLSFLSSCSFFLYFLPIFNAEL